MSKRCELEKMLFGNQDMADIPLSKVMDLQKEVNKKAAELQSKAALLARYIKHRKKETNQVIKKIIEHEEFAHLDTNNPVSE